MSSMPLMVVIIGIDGGHHWHWWYESFIL